MGCDKNFLSSFQLRDYRVIPIGQCALDGQLERFKHGEFFFAWLLGISWVIHDDFVEFTRFVKGRRRDIEASSPNLNLSPRLIKEICLPTYHLHLLFDKPNKILK